jgi:hypothetical protein
MIRKGNSKADALIASYWTPAGIYLWLKGYKGKQGEVGKYE